MAWFKGFNYYSFAFSFNEGDGPFNFHLSRRAPRGLDDGPKWYYYLFIKLPFGYAFRVHNGSRAHTDISPVGFHKEPNWEQT